MTFAVLAKIAAFLRRIPWQVWLVLAVLATGWLWGNHRYAQGEQHERGVWEARIAKAQAEAEKINASADKRKAETDQKINDASQKRQKAIDNAPDDKTDAPGRALACERLRKAGIAAYPTACQ